MTTFADAYSTLLQRYEAQIKQQERHLLTLKKNLQAKEQEAHRWQQKAGVAKEEWTKAGLSVHQARSMVRTLQARRGKTKVMAQEAQWSVLQHATLNQAADSEMRFWIVELYKRQHTPSFFADMQPAFYGTGAVVDQLAALSQATLILTEKAQEQETALRLEEMRWQDEEQKQAFALDHSRHRQQALWLRWQEAQQRRQSLEEERRQIEQSAQALRVMLGELKDHREQTLASRSDTPRARGALKALKGTLPWPVAGTVTQNFGRQYSGTLQQLVISNGIKMETDTGRPVRAIQSGKVLFARPFQQYGQLVIVQHPHGLTSVYGELGQTQVKEGDTLAALDPIGTVGSTRSFYFELRQDEEPINPLVWLAPSHLSEVSTRRKFQ